MDIKIQVLGQKAKITNRHELYSGTVAIEGIQFEFSEEWENMTKTATVYVGTYDRDKAVNILIENNRVAPVQLPSELFEKNCELYVGVFGIDADGRRLTSSIVRQEVKKGVPVQNASDNVSIDVYTRIIQLMTEAKDIAADSDERIASNKIYLDQATEQAEKSKQYAESAEGHLANVETVAGNVSEMQKAIEELKTAAEQSASDASTSEQNASQSEQNASTSEQNAKKSEQNASTYATNASTSASNAKKSETAAATSEQNARVMTEQLAEDVSQLKEDIVDLSDTKKEEISQKGLEVLQSIPADYSALSDATLIKPTVSGTDMVITDSSNMNIQELHLYGKTEQKTTKGKNLFDANAIFSTFIADGRATVTGEGVLINGTFGATNRNFNITLKKGTYYISAGGILHILAPGDSTFDKKIVVEDEEKTFQCYIASGTYTNKLIQPQIEIGSVATDYEPYTGGIASPNPEYPQDIDSVENPTVKIGGSNILNFENKESFEKDGIVFSVVDGVIKVKGTATLNTSFSVARQQYLESNTYIFNPNPTKGVETINCYLDYSNDTNLGMSLASKKINQPVIVADNNSEYLFGLRVSIKQGATVDMEWKPQLLMNNIVLPYEPYKEIQSATLNYELNGIDTVRDELIVRADGTGQLIQRIYWGTIKEQKINLLSNDRVAIALIKKYKALNKYYSKQTLCNLLVGTSQDLTINNDNLCCANGEMVYLKLKDKTNEDTQKWYQENKDNLKIAYPLEEPIVTDLSAEEVQKILALHTNKPNTTIWNDQNADMQITYVADTKNYIDNKFTELSDAIIASASEAE